MLFEFFSKRHKIGDAAHKPIAVNSVEMNVIWFDPFSGDFINPTDFCK